MYLNGCDLKLTECTTVGTSMSSHCGTNAVGGFASATYH